MHVEVEGPEGAPDVVLLHGGIGTGRYHWGKQAKLLAPDHRVHLPDLPGHGGTPLDEGAVYGRTLLVDAVEAYLDGLGRHAVVGGFSMGGHAALALLQRRPDLPAALVLVGVSIRDHDGLRRWRRRFEPENLELEFPMWVKGLRRIHAPLGEEAWRDVCRRDAAGTDVEVNLDLLARYQRPVLLVRGDRDTTVEPAHYAALRMIWPQSEELVVPAGGHDVQLARARILEPALVDFLRRARG